MNDHSSRAWVTYYSVNDASLLEVPWENGYSLTAAERRAISRSIAEFQKGESSEGQHLLSAAREWAAGSDDPGYLEATTLFIKEEQRHARDLRRYMALRGIPVVGSAWPDTVFRSLRRKSGLERSICVLLTAELIAQTYYPALRAATDDPLLIRLCDQIIRDEDAHVVFQAERIASLRKPASAARRAVSRFLQRFLFSGTVVVVWIQHAKVFRRADLPFFRYQKECWRNYRRVEELTTRPVYREETAGG